MTEEPCKYKRSQVRATTVTTVSVLGVVASFVAVAWAVLHWVYGELSSLRAGIYDIKVETSATKATVDELHKSVDRVEDKLDRLVLPHPFGRRSSGGD
jgi:hypothetical protein